MKNPKKSKTVLTISLITLFLCNVQGQVAKGPESAGEGFAETSSLPKNEIEEIIQSFVDDYKSDRYAAKARIVGIEVPEVDGKWTITVTGKEIESKKWEVLLSRGLPKEPTYIYRAEATILKAIHEGELNAMTAQVKAFSSDYAPLDAYEMEGFEPTEEENGEMNAFSFHFWTKGFPEVIPFRPSATRKVHGGNASIFYYEKGLRSGWMSMAPGDRVRDDAREQAQPFPMMGIIIKGTSKGIVDGVPVTVSEGNTVFIPANVNHKWWNESEEPCELILIMFGKGA
ncbi:MAG: cupin domain-containing protein [Bacteroidota bacterium]